MVYVDDQSAPFGRMKLCHMIADTDEELHAMAQRLGLTRRWWQFPENTSGSHYDIALSKRSLAIQMGAMPITVRQCAAMNWRRKVEGFIGEPEGALVWLQQHFAKRRRTS